MFQPNDITQYFIDTHIRKGSIAIDATAGNGNDTLKLCKAVSESGRVIAFDIQKDALEQTERKIKENGFLNVTLIHDTHSNVDKYITEKADAILFNLGYLPGGDHSIHTVAETTLVAIEKSLELISENGFISIMVYYGKNSGSEEKEAVMEYVKKIDYKKFTVIVNDFFNRPNNPPLNVIITRN